MGAATAEAPLRLPAAPPLAFCCYTSVLLLFAFSLPGSRASNQPPGSSGGGGGGSGGDCPGGKGKSINCSGKTGRSPPLGLLPPPLPESGLGRSGWESSRHGSPGEWGPRVSEGGGQGASGPRGAWQAALGTGSGRACVRVCRVAGPARY